MKSLIISLCFLPLLASSFEDNSKDRKAYWKTAKTEYKQKQKEYLKFQSSIGKGLDRKYQELKLERDKKLSIIKRDKNKELQKAIINNKKNEVDAIKLLSKEVISPEFIESSITREKEEKLITLKYEKKKIEINKWHDLQKLELKENAINKALTQAKKMGVWEYPFPPFVKDGNKDMKNRERKNYIRDFKKKYLSISGKFNSILKNHESSKVITDLKYKEQEELHHIKEQEYQKHIDHLKLFAKETSQMIKEKVQGRSIASVASDSELRTSFAGWAHELRLKEAELIGAIKIKEGGVKTKYEIEKRTQLLEIRQNYEDKFAALKEPLLNKIEDFSKD